ncbi:GntR family transcriptional regulator [Lysinibacillus yapensis]|uniref:GntR family transcriptional regulator n=1 Tax=Ureibacillus yapensis TaxID=2304605 RepID=A0A396SBJ1_9BACL|nr:GntR family transcriptional regulator [Lysinibacillus yapensis]
MNPYMYIKDAIIIGELEPGKRLTEEFLASILNVSRTPIREAIKQLESDGLITPYKRRGYIVREFLVEDIKQIYNLRALLESYGTSEASLNRSEEEVEAIRTKNSTYEKAIAQWKRSDITTIQTIQKANQEFHDEIFKATKNTHLQSLISKVVVLPLVFRSFYWYNEHQLIRSLEVHKTILKAIENQEPDRAKIAMQEHIYQGRDDVLIQMNNPQIQLWKGES